MKQLPINKNPEVITDCFNFNRLAMAMTKEENLGWFFEHFFNLYMYDDFSVSYYDMVEQNYMLIFDRVLDISYFKPQKDLFNEIKRSIDNQEYMLVNCNQFYFKGTKAYQNRIYIVETLVIGYDESDKTVICLNLNLEEGVWSINKIFYDDFQEAVGSANEEIYKSPEKYLKLITHNFLFARVRLIENAHLDQVKIQRLIGCVDSYLCGREEYSVIENRKTNSAPRVFRVGISIYEGYYNELYNALISREVELSDNLHIIYGVKKLVESKKNMTKRMKLNTFRLYPHLEGLSEKLGEKLDLAFVFLVKYSFSGKKEHLEKVAGCFKESEQLDKELMNELRRIIMVLIKEELLNYI